MAKKEASEVKKSSGFDGLGSFSSKGGGDPIMLPPVIQPLVFSTFTTTNQRDDSDDDDDEVDQPTAGKGLSIFGMIIAILVVAALFVLPMLTKDVDMFDYYNNIGTDDEGEPIGGVIGVFNELFDVFDSETASEFGDFEWQEYLVIFGVLATLLFALILFLASLFTIKSGKAKGLKIAFIILCIVALAAVIVGSMLLKPEA